MSDKFKLTRVVQCANCPWKKDADTSNIQGYKMDLHIKLADTISDGTPSNIGSELKVMSCHKSKEGADEMCIGWAHNQLGAGNNIGLRMKMLFCENAKDIRVVGEQHYKFEDTIK